MKYHYYNEIKDIPKNDTSYAYYARTTDKSVNIFADFETTSQRWYIVDKEDKVKLTYEFARDNNIDVNKFLYDYPDYEFVITDEPVKVWLAGAYVLEENKFYYMTDIEHFMNFISQYKLVNLYMHNGGNFDFRFIHDYLNNNNFAHLKDSDRPYTDTFYVGSYASSTIYNKGQMCNLRDTLDVIKSSIKAMGENLAIKDLSMAKPELKDYYKYNNGTYQLSKGETPIKFNTDNLEPSDYDLDYLFRDVMILTLSSTRQDSYDLPKFFSNGLRTTASLAEAYMFQPSLRDELKEKEFTLDHTTKTTRDKTRLVTGWYFSNVLNQEVPTYRDNGQGGKRTADYTPTIDESRWLHTNYGIHEHGYKYLKAIDLDVELKFEWDGDYLEYRVKKGTKTKFNKIDDPNAYDMTTKLVQLPLPKKYNAEEQKFVRNGKVKGKNYSKEHVYFMRMYLLYIKKNYLDPLQNFLIANEALGFAKATYNSKYQTLASLKKERDNIIADLVKIQERIKQEKYMIELEIVRDWTHNSYKGGICYVNPLFQNKWVEELICIIDINSMYPWLYSSLALPGKFKRNNDKFEFDSYIETEELGFVVIRSLKAKIKEGRMPFYKMRTNVLDNQQSEFNLSISSHEYYLPKIDIEVTHCITLLEYRALMRNYDIEDIDIKCFYYCERNTELMNAFKNHALYWMTVKEEAKKSHNLFMIMFSKLMLNSPYGKLGNYKKEYDRDFITEAGRQKSMAKDSINKRHANIESATYITAYGRVYLSECINAIGLDKFLYCDTDSIHYIGDISDITGIKLPDYLPEAMRTIKVHDTELGAWAHEGTATLGKYIKPKCYGEDVGEWKTTVAGVRGCIPKKAFKTYEADEDSPIYTLRSKNVEGGVNIYNSNFKIKPIHPLYLLATGQYSESVKELARMSRDYNRIAYIMKSDNETI